MMQVGVIGAELVGQEHALIDERAAGERHGVEADVVAAGLAIDGARDHLAQDVELALEIRLVGDVGAAADEHLPMHGLGGDDGVGQTGIVGRHVAPTQELEPLGVDHALHHLLAIDALGGVARHEQIADGVMAGLGQRDADGRAGDLEEVMRDLHQDAGAVAGERVGARGAAMGQIDEDLEAVLDDAVARAALQIGDEADATGIVLVLRIIESLRWRRALPHRVFHSRTLPPYCHHASSSSFPHPSWRCGSSDTGALVPHLENTRRIGSERAQRTGAADSLSSACASPETGLRLEPQRSVTLSYSP